VVERAAYVSLWAGSVAAPGVHVQVN